jgi:hypothetical protein
MPFRMRSMGRVAVAAGVLALGAFGLAASGALGPVGGTSAILETTAQSPTSVLPRPSAAPGGQPSTGTADRGGADLREAILLSVAAVVLLGGVGLRARRRARPASVSTSPAANDTTND